MGLVSMCGQVNQAESVTTMIGVIANLYADQAENASLLLHLYERDCAERGADETCVMASLLSASVYVGMNLAGHEGPERINIVKHWWAAQCPVN